MSFLGNLKNSQFEFNQLRLRFLYSINAPVCFWNITYATCHATLLLWKPQGSVMWLGGRDPTHLICCHGMKASFHKILPQRMQLFGKLFKRKIFDLLIQQFQLLHQLLSVINCLYLTDKLLECSDGQIYNKINKHIFPSILISCNTFEFAGQFSSEVSGIVIIIPLGLSCPHTSECVYLIPSCLSKNWNWKKNSRDNFLPLIL